MILNALNGQSLNKRLVKLKVEVFILFIQSMGDQNDKYDIFRIEKKYQTKNGGKDLEWFMDMKNFDKDDQIETRKDDLESKNNGEYWNGTPDSSMNPASFRVVVYTKNGNRQATKDHRKANTQGYMADPSDWKNVEFTGYCRVKSPRDPQEEITIYSRSGRHTNGKRFNTKSCTGTAYKPGLEFTGRPTFKKEYWHSGGYAPADTDAGGESNIDKNFVPDEIEGTVEVELPQTDVSEGLGGIAEKWVGVKGIFYNTKEQVPEEHVTTEYWYDLVGSVDHFERPPNQWKQLYSITDDGTNMGSKGKTGSLAEGEGCNAISDREIFTWGGPEVTLRIDKVTSVDFKWLSVREIDPLRPVDA